MLSLSLSLSKEVENIICFNIFSAYKKCTIHMHAQFLFLFFYQPRLPRQNCKLQSHKARSQLHLNIHAYARARALAREIHEDGEEGVCVRAKFC